jgi:oligoendopeptidase F
MQDLETVLSIYAYARLQMKKNGNPNQWGDSRPSVETIKADINSRTSFLVTQGEEICGVFTFRIDPDPTPMPS